MIIPYWNIGKDTTHGGGGASFGGDSVNSVNTLMTDGNLTVNRLGVTDEQMEQIKKYGLIAGAVLVVIMILRG